MGWTTLLMLLLGIGLIVLAGRIRARSERRRRLKVVPGRRPGAVGPRPSVARSVRGQQGTSGASAVSVSETESRRHG